MLGDVLPLTTTFIKAAVSRLSKKSSELSRLDKLIIIIIIT